MVCLCKACPLDNGERIDVCVSSVILCVSRVRMYIEAMNTTVVAVRAACRE